MEPERPHAKEFLKSLELLDKKESNKSAVLLAIAPSQPRSSVWVALSAIFIGTIFLTPILFRAPLLGWDWLFAYVNIPPSDIYTPWIDFIVFPLRNLPWRTGFAIANALTVMSISIVTFREGNTWWKYLGVLFALVNPPVWFILWDGQIDGWGLVGLLAMPIGIPLVLMKPTMITFAILARKDWFILSIIFGIFSILIWGSWPLKLLGTVGSRVEHPVAMGWSIQGHYLLMLGLILLLFTNRKDPFQHIAVGAFLHPFVMPYHFVLLLPVLGRLKNTKQLVAWFLNWLLVLEVGFGGIWKDIVFLLPLCIWLFLRQDESARETWLHFLISELKKINANNRQFDLR